MCKEVEQTSKKNRSVARGAAECAYQNRRWTYSDIWHAYDRPSAAKVAAWEYCRQLCDKLNGYDLLIASRNTFAFSVVFTFEDEDGRECYAYITRDYDRFCYAD